MLSVRQFVTFLAFVFLQPLAAQKDPGQNVVGKLKVELIYASNTQVSEGGVFAEKRAETLRRLKSLNFAHYRLLGVDTKKVLRGYQNWASPLKDSNQLMLSFQPLGELTQEKSRLDIELWQQRKKILKANPSVKLNKSLYIKGPKWRDGYVIIAVTLVKISQ